MRLWIKIIYCFHMLIINVDDQEIHRYLRKLTRVMSDLTPIMRGIAGIMHSAVEENFEQEGRPPWPPSRRALRQGGKTLQDTGRLAASITSSYTRDSAIVGTNVKYGAIHQFGGRTGAREIRPRRKKALFWPGALHPVRRVLHPGASIPKRAFLSLSEGDRGEIIFLLAKHLTP